MTQIKTLKILDIDLDFFLDDVKFRNKRKPRRRLNKKKFRPWARGEVEEFLESQCGLDKSNSIKGMNFTDHDEVFDYLRSMQLNTDNYILKFDIDHVDAHADLGFGDSSYDYIQTNLLHKPILDRFRPKIKGIKGLSEGNFLTFAIACQWLSKLRYVSLKSKPTDIPKLIFKNFAINGSNDFIQLKRLSEFDVIELLNGLEDTVLNRLVDDDIDPAIPFEVVHFLDFQDRVEYDYIFLTQSPGYTPRTSDDLIPIINEYMKF